MRLCRDVLRLLWGGVTSDEETRGGKTCERNSSIMPLHSRCNVVRLFTIPSFVVTIIMFTAIASMLLTTSCEKSSKTALHGDALQSQIGDDNDKTAAVLSDPGLDDGSGDSELDGGVLGDDPIGTIDPFELEDWDIRPFTDPRTNETYDIIDGRVIIAFTNPPVLPVVDPNYFDTEILPTDPYYMQFTVPDMGTDIAIQAFIAAENLTVYSEWNTVKGIGAILPEGQTVEDAVENWPTEYAGLVEAVDPDAIDKPDYGVDQINDDLFNAGYYWNLYDGNYPAINIQSAWAQGWYGSSSIAIAVIDSGVQRNSTFTDLNANLMSWGVNTGDKKASSTWATGDGKPWQWLLDKNWQNARDLGHGTCVAGIIGAGTNNDPDPFLLPYTIPGSVLPTDFAGINRSCAILPIAMKQEYTGISKSAIINAYTMVGCIKSIYNRRGEFGNIGLTIPYKNIEVANCSYGGYTLTTVEARHLAALTPYILFCCSAGNDNLNKSGYPAAYPACMSVAAIVNDGTKWYDGPNQGSNYGGVHIAAPTKVPTTDMMGTNSYMFPLGYTSHFTKTNFSGTSAAAPHVSAVAGLAAWRFPDQAPNSLKMRIINRGKPPFPCSGLSCNYLDAYNALLN